MSIETVKWWQLASLNILNKSTKYMMGSDENRGTSDAKGKMLLPSI